MQRLLIEWIKRQIENQSACPSLSVLKNTFSKDVITQALIDSGSSINCLDWGFIRRHNLSQYHLPTPICSKNVDGSYNGAGIIKYITTMFIQIKRVIHQVLFHIINCGNENVILGNPWLENINPLIDWANWTVEIPDHSDRTPNFNQKNKIVQGTITTTPTHANLLHKEFVREKPTYPHENIVNFLCREEVTSVVNKFKKVDGKFSAVTVCKTTIVTELAKWQVPMKLYSLIGIRRGSPSLPSLLAILPPYWPQWLLCSKSRKGLPSHPLGTKSHGRLPWRKPLTRKNSPLELPPSLIFPLD